MPEQPWSARPVIHIWPGVAPGSENDTRTEISTPGGPHVHILRNIVTPTLTVFQPKGGNTTDSAVLIVPGGGFRVLAIEEEGYPTADWFSQHGVTAFVLKYRLAPTPGTDAEFAPGNLSPAEVQKRGSEPLPPEVVPHAVADGIQALKVLRASAAKYGFDPSHVNAVGFSAGGSVVLGTMGAEPASDRPSYAGIIYSGLLPLAGQKAPDHAPPTFLAVAIDDKIAFRGALGLFNALREQGDTPEMHVYRSGQHGFTMKQRGTSDHWIDEFWWWLGTYGRTDRQDTDG